MIRAPAFDHATKDPIKDAITIPLSASVLIIEGNWLLYDEEPWREISGLVDDTWFVDVEPELVRWSLARRHVQSGIEEIWEEAVSRAESSDLLNGEIIRRRLVKPNVRVRSVNEKGRELRSLIFGQDVSASVDEQPRTLETAKLQVG